MIKRHGLRYAVTFVFAAAFAVFAHHHDQNVSPAFAHLELAQAETQTAAVEPVVTPAETPAVAERTKRGMEIGARAALGNTYTLGVDLRTPISETMRIYYGLDGGYVFGTFGYHAYSIETNVFAEFVHNISKEGDFRFFWGFGGAFGWQGVWGDKAVVKVTHSDPQYDQSGNMFNQYDPTNPILNDEENYPRVVWEKDSGNNWNFGLGLKFGLETELAFIDSEHSLYRLRDATVSVDFRPTIYFLDVNGLEKYPTLVWAIGLSFRWLI